MSKIALHGTASLRIDFKSDVGTMLEASIDSQCSVRGDKARMKQLVMYSVMLVSTLSFPEVACADQEIVTIDVCPSTRSHFRNDWSLIFPLKRGRLMLVWCEYYATSSEQVLHERKSNYLDAAACRISARISTDRRWTWSDTFTLQDSTARLNVKHPNILRVALHPSRILMFFTSRRVDGGKHGDAWRPHVVAVGIRS